MSKKKQPHPTEMTEERAEELGKCFNSYTYFINYYCKIYDSVQSYWIPFRLWDEQKELLHHIHDNQLTVILKARQLGISWLTLGYGLWQMIFQPIAGVSIFSRRETEAIYLLGEDRMRGMYNNLPPWMKTGHDALIDSGKEWKLGNGSVARAFPTSAGDSYVSTFAIVDEADLSPDLNKLMGAVKPTIDNGGRMVLLSRVNKSEPESEFKNIYRGAVSGDNPWKSVFLPWNVHPGRDSVWYENQKRDILSRTGALDDLYEQYPATDEQALSAKTLDKRIPPVWIETCFTEIKPKLYRGSPSINGLDILIPPTEFGRYVIGADPAEGNPNSDDSVATVVDIENGEEYAVLVGKYEPAMFASYISDLSLYYNLAPTLVERNNHGHSVIQWLEEHARRVRLLLGHDAETHRKDKRSSRRRKTLKYGWLSSTVGKTILYTICTEHFRTCSDAENDYLAPVKVLHSRQTLSQLSSIEADKLSAPRGMHDDRADSYALAQAARKQVISRGHSAGLVVGSVQGWGF